jgi:hypothetical protein
VNRPERSLGAVFAGLAVMSATLVGCGTTSAPPTTAGTAQTSANALTSAPVASHGPTTTTASPHLAAADAQAPASGVCAKAVGVLVVITANPDTPAPRCAIVTGGQHLKVVNASNQFGQSGKTITVSFAGFSPRQVAVGAATTFDQSFGSYLAPGVHDLHINLYSGSATAIWLR